MRLNEKSNDAEEEQSLQQAGESIMPASLEIKSSPRKAIEIEAEVLLDRQSAPLDVSFVP